MASFFAESNRLATVFGDVLFASVKRELEMTVPLNPQVSIRNILEILRQEDGTALWLDRECVLVDAWYCANRRHCRYEVDLGLRQNLGRQFYLYQVPGTREHGNPLPALEYFFDRLTSNDNLHYFEIEAYNDDDDNDLCTLDVSPACFSNLLQTSGERSYSVTNQREYSVTLRNFSLTAEQTMLLFTHDTGPICIGLDYCRFDGPTLLQLGSAALEQPHLLELSSYLYLEFGDEGIFDISLAELTVLMSNPHLRYLRCYSVDGFTYEIMKKLVSALAANKISRMDRLDLEKFGDGIEWERKEEPSTWIDFWKAVEKHPSLKEIYLQDYKDQPDQPGLCQQSWWEPIATAVKVNPRLVLVRVGDEPTVYRTNPWKTKLEEYVEPLLARNRYRPKIAALCCTDPSKAAILLGQAVVALANSKFRREIHQMLLEQLVLTGYDFGVAPVLGKKRPLVEMVEVVPNDFVTKTKPRVEDGIAAITNDKNNEANLK